MSVTAAIEEAAVAYECLDGEPAVWSAPTLIVHLHQVWGMDLAAAIHAVAAAVQDGEHMVLYTDREVAGRG